jgi:hypothetical protein
MVKGLNPKVEVKVSSPFTYNLVVLMVCSNLVTPSGFKSKRTWPRFCFQPRSLELPRQPSLDAA